ncbi:MAG: 1-deoxy-D-xylulose-5-phosphate synthase [Clostridia bacterium]|nr:1-deoxy-D-xylulose-5-phosphate synthase [Clostridia bacterium]
MADYKYLDKINSPADLKMMQEDEIAPLASEIRSFLIEKVEQNGGHLASNLGVVELTIAIHRVFDVPNDHLIFDVGHQSYVHKIITGRKDRFDTLRQGGGLSGFTKRSESESDCFGSGHSSTSISAGLGFAQADKLLQNDATTVVVLGDGAFTGGMVHEALNNCEKDLKLIIVLNENEMSISKNIGGFAKVLTKLRLQSTYIDTKNFVKNVLSKIPLIGKPLFKLLRNTKKRVKDIFYGSNYFENLGLFYVGPIDGHNEKQLEDALRVAKSCKESAIVHITTIKGKGYAPAEENPGKYHGISPKNSKPQTTNFSEEFGKYLTEMAKEDDKVCAITAAMLDGTGLLPFASEFPNRTFDVGIAEEHALTFASGLTAEGMKPYFAVYSTFLQRSYDNVLHDMALQNLPVKICIDRAGLNASDGPTHHGIFDVAMLSQVPNMTLYAPASYESLRKALNEANSLNSPCAIRYNKGEQIEDIINEFKSVNDKIGIKTNFDNAENLNALIITHGNIVEEAIKAKNILLNEGISVGIILVERIMPYTSLAKDILAILPQKPIKILTLEQEIKAGGFGMMLFDKLRQKDIMQNKKFDIIALEDTFADKYGENIYKSFGLDAMSIVCKIKEM